MEIDWTLILISAFGLGVLSLLYRSVVALERNSGTSLRAAEKERREYFALIEKLTEKRDNPTAVKVVDNHSRERIQRMAIDKTIDKPTPPPAPPGTFEGEYASEVEAIQ